MAVRDETVRFVYDTTGDKDLATTAGLLVKMADAGKLTDDESIKLAASLKTLAAQSKAVSDALSQKAALAETANQFAAAQKKAADLASTLERTGASAKEVNRAYAASDAELAKLTALYGKQDIALQKSLGSLEKAGIDTTNLAAASAKLSEQSVTVAVDLAKVGTAASTASEGTKKLSSEGGKIGSAFQSARDAINSFASGLLRITGIAGAVSTVLGALSIGRLFGGAVTSAKDFESALSEVKAVAGATADELKQMRAAAENASKSTKFSATESVQALGELARASGNAKDAIAELPATLTLAQAAGLGAAESATILTTAITQFGLAASDATRVADLFTREANSTNDNVQNLGLSMSYVAPLAKQLGESIESTTAILGALAEQGFRGERAGTALRNVFSQLLDPTSKFRGELVGLGIQTTDFATIINGLSKAGEQGRKALLALDSEARPAIASLVSSGGAGIRRLTEDFKSAGGEAARTAKTMGENFDGAASRLRNAFDALRRALIDPILDPLAKQFDDVADRVRAFADTKDFARIQQSIKEFVTGAVDAIIKFVRSVDFAAVTKSIGDFAKSSGEFFKSIGDSSSAVATTIGVVVNTISLAFNLLKTVVLGATGAAVEGIALLAKTAVLAAEAGARLSGTFGLMKPVFDDLYLRIGGLSAVAEEFGKRADAGSTAARGAFDALSASVATTAAAFGNVEHGAETTAPKLQAVADAAVAAKSGMDQAAEAGEKVAEGLSKISPAALKIQTEITQVGFRLSELKDSGQGFGEEADRLRDRLTALDFQLLQIQQGAQKSKPSIDDLKSAFAGLGVESQASLEETADKFKKFFDTINRGSDETAKGLADRQAAFIAYADAALKAAANVNQATYDQTKYQLDAQASALGLTDKLEKVRTSGVRAGKDTADAFRQTSAAIRDSGKASEESAQSYQVAARAIEAASAETDKHRGSLQGYTLDLSQFSAAAIKAYSDAQDAALRYGISNDADVEQYVRTLNNANRQITAAIKQQQTDANTFVENYSNLTDRQILDIARQSGGFEGLKQTIEGTAGSLGLLNDQDLGRVQAAADALSSKIDALREKTESALQSFRDYADSVQDQLDQANGNQQSIEDRRHEKELADLKEQAELSDTLGTAEYNAAIAAENQLHDLKMKNAREEQSARGTSSGSGGGGSVGGGSASSGSDNQGSSSPSPAPAPAPRTNVPAGGFGLGPITINVTGFLPGDSQTMDAFARRIRQELTRLNGFHF